MSPKRLRRASTSAASPSSPPKRCATPETSSISPSAPSRATRGVKRAQKSATRSRSLPSAIGSASTAASAGWRARASASVRPGVRPSRAASASTPTRRCAFLIFATTTRGAAAVSDAQRAPRAVGRQARQPQGEETSVRQTSGPRFARSGGRFRVRVEALRRPLRRRQARLDEPRGEGGRPGQSRVRPPAALGARSARRRSRSASRRRWRAFRPRHRRSPDQQRRHRRRRVRRAAGGARRRGRSPSDSTSPTTTAGAPLLNASSIAWNKAGASGARTKTSRLAPARARPVPARRARPSRVSAKSSPKRTPRAALGHEARGERQRETHRRRPVAGRGGRDLVQRVAGKPAAERAIERAGQRKPSRSARLRRPRTSLDLGDGAPQTRHPLSPVAPRHPIRTLYVRTLF